MWNCVNSITLIKLTFQVFRSIFNKSTASNAIVTIQSHANTTFAIITSFREKWPMFVYTNIGLSQKVHVLKICNSEPFYIRSVLVCVVKIIKFAQRELGVTIKRLLTFIYMFITYSFHVSDILNIQWELSACRLSCNFVCYFIDIVVLHAE